jgi:hypothetical protein
MSDADAWYQAITANNPNDFTLRTLDDRLMLYLNNPMGPAPRYNPYDWSHPGAFAHSITHPLYSLPILPV